MGENLDDESCSPALSPTGGSKRARLPGAGWPRECARMPLRCWPPRRAAVRELTRLKQCKHDNVSECDGQSNLENGDVWSFLEVEILFDPVDENWFPIRLES